MVVVKAIKAAFASVAFILAAAPVPFDASRHHERLATEPRSSEARIWLKKPERIRLPDGQVKLIRSLLRTDRPLRYGQLRWDEQESGTGPVWIRVDLTRQIISVFRESDEIGTAVILYGADAVPTPTGVYPIRAKYRQHRSSIYDADMPFTLRLTDDGIAIHASLVREGAATHGCIGVPRSFAEKLFDTAQLGTEVAIQA